MSEFSQTSTEFSVAPTKKSTGIMSVLLGILCLMFALGIVVDQLEKIRANNKIKDTCYASAMAISDVAVLPFKEDIAKLHYNFPRLQTAAEQSRRKFDMGDPVYELDLAILKIYDEASSCVAKHKKKLISRNY